MNMLLERVLIVTVAYLAVVVVAVMVIWPSYVCGIQHGHGSSRSSSKHHTVVAFGSTSRNRLRRQNYDENQIAATMLLAAAKSAQSGGVAGPTSGHVGETRPGAPGTSNPEGRKPASVCYEEFGCFDRQLIGALPEHPDLVQPQFRLFIKELGSTSMLYSYNSSFEYDHTVTVSALTDRKRKLVFVIHGFGGNADLDWIQEITIAETERYSANVIVVDWEEGARYSTLYERAAANALLIGKATARFCLRLTGNYHIPLESVEIIGFSLGGQVAGFFAGEVFGATGRKVGKITALDTAAPLFEPAGIYPRKEHTKFLEAVHTSAGNIIWRGKLGIEANYGHVDYYPNGGIDQPGCTFPNIGCAHQRAVMYYAEALADRSECRYEGYRCSSVSDAHTGLCGPEKDRRLHLGMAAVGDEIETAIVYLKTNSSPPFCLTNDLLGRPQANEAVQQQSNANNNSLPKD